MCNGLKTLNINSICTICLKGLFLSFLCHWNVAYFGDCDLPRDSAIIQSSGAALLLQSRLHVSQYWKVTSASWLAKVMADCMLRLSKYKRSTKLSHMQIQKTKKVPCFFCTFFFFFLLRCQRTKGRSHEMKLWLLFSCWLGLPSTSMNGNIKLYETGKLTKPSLRIWIRFSLMTEEQLFTRLLWDSLWVYHSNMENSFMRLTKWWAV